MTVSAQAAYGLVSQTLAQCESDKSDGAAVQMATALGFVERPRRSDYELTHMVFTDSTGSTVTLSQRWHDPSGPFQNEPDIHRVRVTLQPVGQASTEHMIEWQE
jgi:hypothetical protein